MAWTSDRCYLLGIDHFTRCVHLLGADDWSRPSPCARWSALDVLGHVGGGTRFGTELLSGRQPAMPPMDNPGSVVDGEPVAWWDSLAGPAKDAVAGADLTKVVDSPMGPRSIDEGLRFPAIDLFVHGWDLAKVAGHTVELPDEIVEFTHRAMRGFPDEMIRNPRVFAPALDTPAGAGTADAFLAWTGRDPSWTPPR